MAESVEVLMTNPEPHGKQRAILDAVIAALTSCGCRVELTRSYKGSGNWLVFWGAGALGHDKARKHQIKTGRHVLLWDMGYFIRELYVRCSVDEEHPWRLFDKTPDDTERWSMLNIGLREDADPNGHIVLVGLGKKSRAYLHEDEWEKLRLHTLRQRFPGREIIYRPKPGSPAMKLNCKIDADSPIENVLRGAALVSCRHSNVACDAVVAGVPFECDEGAAMWLKGKEYTVDNRMRFLRKLAWWQWRPNEAAQAWSFVNRVVA